MYKCTCTCMYRCMASQSNTITACLYSLLLTTIPVSFHCHTAGSQSSEGSHYAPLHCHSSCQRPHSAAYKKVKICLVYVHHCTYICTSIYNTIPMYPCSGLVFTCGLNDAHQLAHGSNPSNTPPYCLAPKQVHT